MAKKEPVKLKIVDFLRNEINECIDLCRKVWKMSTNDMCDISLPMDIIIAMDEPKCSQTKYNRKELINVIDIKISALAEQNYGEDWRKQAFHTQPISEFAELIVNTLESRSAEFFKEMEQERRDEEERRAKKEAWENARWLPNEVRRGKTSMP